MEYGTMVKVATITLWNFFALIVNVAAFVIIYMKANKNASLKAFFVVQSSMMIWLIGKIFKTVSPNADLRWFFIVFYYFGICLLEVSFLDFSYIYYKGKAMNRYPRIALYSIGLLGFLIVVTNPHHYLFYSRYSFWGDDFGKLFYVHVVINYLLILIGMVLCSIKFKKQLSDKTRLERNLISIAIIVPLVLNFIYITRTLEALFDYLQIQVFDITPIVYTWSILVFVYATFKYEFFDLTPIMKHEVAKKLDNPILIVDSDFNVLYTNTEFDHLFEDAEGLVNKLYIKTDNTHEKILKHNNMYYTYFVNNQKSMDGEKFIICFTDVTAYHIANCALDKENRELAVSNQKLENQIEMLKQTSHVGARNYIARELHDILGHSLVVTIKLLEVSKMFYLTKKDRAYESLEKAALSIENGFNEMKNITSKDNTMIYNTVALEKEIRSMLKVVDVSGVKVNFFMRGKSKVIDEKIYDTLKKIITELVTNTLKHSKATNLLLMVTTYDEQIAVQTMDNGVGAKNLVKGNGLNGIDGRLALVSGKAKYTSESNEGFAANIVVPL